MFPPLVVLSIELKPTIVPRKGFEKSTLERLSPVILLETVVQLAPRFVDLMKTRDPVIDNTLLSTLQTLYRKVEVELFPTLVQLFPELVDRKMNVPLSIEFEPTAIAVVESRYVTSLSD